MKKFKVVLYLIMDEDGTYRDNPRTKPSVHYVEAKDKSDAEFKAQAEETSLRSVFNIITTEV